MSIDLSASLLDCLFNRLSVKLLISQFVCLLLSLCISLFVCLCIFYTFQGLDSEVTSKTMYIFCNFNRTSWTGDRHITMPLHTQGITTHKTADIHPRIEWCLRPRSQFLSDEKPYSLWTVRPLVSAFLFACR